MKPEDQKALNDLFNKVATPPDPYDNLQWNSLASQMQYMRGMPYHGGGVQSQNVDDMRGRQAQWATQLNEGLNGPIDPLEPGAQAYMYPNNPISGMPLSGDQVQQWAQQQPSYKDPEELRRQWMIHNLEMYSGR